MPILLQSQTALVRERPAQREFSCVQFLTAGLGTIQIIVVGQSVASTPVVSAVSDALRRELILLLGTATDAPCGGEISDPTVCRANHIQKRFLVVVCDDDEKLDPSAIRDPLLATFYAGPPDGKHVVVPIISKPVSLHKILADTPNLSLNQVSRWDGKPSMTAIDVLQCTGLLEEDQRIFISYKQADTAALADQIAIELTKLNFAVFLDRFSIGVGVEFQPRLMQELADKAVVVALESQHLLDSKWVRDEIDFARVHRIGVVALNISNAPEIDSVADDQRVRVTSSDLDHGVLRPASLLDLMQRIREEHARALFKRKWELAHGVRTVLAAAAVAGLRFDEHGLLEARDARGASHKILAIARPGDLMHYHYLDELRTASTPGHEGAIVASVPFREAARKKRIEWLSAKSSIRYFYEGDLQDLVSLLN